MLRRYRVTILNGGNEHVDFPRQYTFLVSAHDADAAIAQTQSTMCEQSRIVAVALEEGDPIMTQTKPAPKAGDPCPQCGGALKARRAPTDAERAAATDRENPRAYPPNVDTAAPEQIAELGALHVCTECGYRTRIAGDRGGRASSGAPARDGQASPTEPANAKVAQE